MNALFSKLTSSRSPFQRDAEVRRIGDYSIVRKIGTGATSHVYLGLHVDSMQTAAIKLLSLQYSSPSHHHMLAIEASLCGKLNHPNIVGLHGADLDAADGPYLVMEYVDGNSLDKFDRSENLLPVETVVNIMRQSAEALRYASELGIVHRDVKPGNIIVRKDGVVKIADFGCAISRSNVSPEQIEGKPLTHQSDIYSLGAVFYRLLTGQYPHPMKAGQNPQAYANRILKSSPAPIETYRRHIPPTIASFVYRALQKKLKARHASWNEFIEELQHAVGAVDTTEYLPNINWQGTEIRRRQRAAPRTGDWSFSFSM